ncbi:GPI transamidase component PIG-S [Purpureocillium lavendulum]|uniref:alpha-galactosidase n=1 Tax=Purpureocillium lavendulum TaxID=1247861 RepID=A0AB34FGD1_9HYPO|nr:GPI transamidase component PIG-S [Purpureocillium lavendulum]
MALQAALLLVVMLLRCAAGQTTCGGTLYLPGSTTNFTRDCYDAIQSCTAQFMANSSQVDCSDGNNKLWMQQQSNRNNNPPSNNDASIAFQDIRDLCVLSGQTSGTWGYSDNQWYWIAASEACYTSDPTRTDVVPTHKQQPYCIQNRDSSLSDCYPEPAATRGGALKVVKTARTRGGYHAAARGWNTYGVQALQNGSQVVPSFAGQSGLNYNQKFVETQCGVMASPAFRAAGYTLCSLDSGWQAFDGVDDHGRILYNATRFNLPQLGSWLHGRGLELGVYVTPGVPCVARNKTILGTKTKLGDVLAFDNQIFCDFDYAQPAVQTWHDSVIKLWASWGVDMIKLDFITPGSPQNGANLGCDTSASVRAYQRAIERSGRRIRLDISWKLCRNETWLPVWSSLADSLRTDQDLNAYGTNHFMEWQVGQRAINNYRQYIGLQAQRGVPVVTVFPDLDSLFSGNPEWLSGVNDTIRYTVTNHWLGAAANLIVGNDLTQLDDLAPQTVAAANFFASYPMQPRNPGTGGNSAQQLQAWIGGPSDNGREAYVLIVNYGPDQGYGGFGTKIYGKQAVTVSLKDLGVSGVWSFKDVWAGNATKVAKTYTAYLAEGASQLLHLTKTH